MNYKVDCPRDLLLVTAKHRRIANYFLLNLKGREISSEGHKGILRMNTLLSACCPPTISSSIALS